MTQVVRTERAGGVATVVIENPPVNALSHAVRSGLWAAVVAADDDPDVTAIVIRAEGRTFPAGADISEFDAPPQDPWLPELCDRIEACTKPVVAALHGTALGGGLELALAAHYRVALDSARMGLPEVTLGILPGAGGTQRTPRLIGAAEALKMMLGGAPVTAPQALAMGLIDGVVEDHLAVAAQELARMLAAEGAGPRRTRDRTEGLRDTVAFAAAVAAARVAHEGDRLPAPGRIVDCVEAAQLLPFDQGLAFERAAFDDLVTTGESAGLRHAFFAERAAARVPEARARPRPVAHVGIVGAGRLGCGIAFVLLQAGLRVTLVDKDRDALTDGLKRIATAQEREVVQGRMTEAARDADWARLGMALDPAALAEVDLAVETVPEDMRVKASVLSTLSRILRPGAILATSTATLDVDALAGSTGRPADVLGLHVVAEAPGARLVEVVVGRATAADVTATGFGLVRRLGRIGLRSGPASGFVAGRVLDAGRRAADFLLEEGARPATVDAALRGFGFALGPYQALDRTGLEPAAALRRRRDEAGASGGRKVAIGDRLIDRGWTGVAAGRGYYIYDKGREGREDPAVLAVIDAERAAKGITPRRVGADEIVARVLSAMANEGARLVGEGVALRPSDVDVAMVAGAGFPRWQGGPMHWADRRGLLVLRTDLRRFAAQAPQFWATAPLIDALIREGLTFADLNRADLPT